MSDQVTNKIELEIAHILFIDIVGYSKLSINEQRAVVDDLTTIVRSSDHYQRAEAVGRLIKIPTGDGMALVFYTSQEAPAQCAIEISGALKAHPRLQVRMGVHSGPVSGVIDVNGHANLAGAGINMAQRVMNCGDAGHILVSKHVAEDLEEYEHWRPFLHDLGSCEVKHGVRIGVTNLYSDEVGNPNLPSKLQAVKKHHAHMRWAAVAIALLVVAALVSLAIFRYQRAQFSQLDRAIAVLPFENLSSNADDRFFVVGIQDEILTKLASLADLKVIARTSTQGYQSNPVDLRTVGRQLSVGRVLKGSLQRSADKVRVNVQLIDTRSNAHLWASSYDRKLNDIFAVESEVANTIAQQLDERLVQKISTKPPTTNTAAYNAYLRGVGIEHSQAGGNVYEDAATSYAEAVRLDPNFALAWARLSIVRSFLYYHSVNPSANSAVAVKEAADLAMSLAPELGEVWLAQGTYRSRVLNDPAKAVAAYREAQKRLPNSALVNEYMAYAERRLGGWREAEVHLTRATELDPRNARLWTSAAYDIFWPLGRGAEAEAALDRALEISRNDEFTIALKTELYQQEGKLNEAAKELARIPKDSTDKTVLIHRVDQALFERNFDEALFWASKATSSPSPGQSLNTQDIFALVLQGYCQLWAGRNEEARTTFQRVIREVAPGGVLRTPPLLGSRLYLAAAYAGLADRSNAHEQARQAVSDTRMTRYLSQLPKLSAQKL